MGWPREIGQCEHDGCDVEAIALITVSGTTVTKRCCQEHVAPLLDYAAEWKAWVGRYELLSAEFGKRRREWMEENPKPEAPWEEDGGE